VQSHGPYWLEGTVGAVRSIEVSAM
jgi:hypothetical protein